MGKNIKDIQPRVVIGVPCNGRMQQRTAHAIGCAIIKAGGVVVDFMLYTSCDIVSSRSWLAKEAVKKQATHLLFIDSDMIFKNDIIPRLLSHDKDIVGVEYPRRKFPIEDTFLPLTEKSKTDLYKANFVGAGVLLINLNVFKDGKLAQPWFNFGRDSQGMLSMGEDAWFCHTAQDAGYDVWIDPTVKCGHIGEFVYNMDNNT